MTYVFVEPSYQAKNRQDSRPSEVKKDEAADQPTVRAQEAAARFSDKTAAELLPVSAHAAQAQNTPTHYARGQSGSGAEGSGRAATRRGGTEVYG